MFGNLTHNEFLQQYWQKKPRLIRNALPMAESPLSAEELAGLACEVEGSARIVQENHCDAPWKVSYGPFNEKDFAALPETHWTLLVTDCEKHLPELASLLQPFRFIPNWRIDDLMISYAVDSGSVGPHVDEYDVFLLQLEGEREWQIGQSASLKDCQPDFEINILKQFTPENIWKLSPGDMLYLPPGISHHGIARGSCMTASIGFRAPSHREILQAWLEHVVIQIPDDLRLTDPELIKPSDPGEISTIASEKFRTIIDLYLDQSRHEFPTWLGNFLTESHQNQLDFESERMTQDQFLSAITNTSTLLSKNPYIRFAWQAGGEGIIFSANGQSWQLSKNLQRNISLLCNQSKIQTHEWNHLDNPELIKMLYTLYSDHCIELITQ